MSQVADPSVDVDHLGLQAVQVVAPACENEPIGQGVQLVPSQKSPALHLGTQSFPTFVYDGAQMSHEVAAFVDVVQPVGQFVHAKDPN